MKRKPRRHFEAKDKITAVLSVWTERRTATQMCKEMAISPALLNQWQNLAMEGILMALSPKRKEQPALLSSRIARLVEKSLPDPTAKLQKRLKAIESKKAS